MAADLAIKEPCRVATTGNISSLSGLLTIDGVTVAAGNRVLVRAQTTATQNGIYTAASGSWTRATDFDGAGEVTGGTQVYVQQGTTLGDIAWRVAGDAALTPGTNAIAFEPEYQQTGANAAPRALQAKAREMVSILDYRTTADDNDSLAAAFAAGKTHIYFPPGQGLGAGGEYEIECAFGGSPPAPGNITESGVWLSGGGIGRTVFRRQTRPVFMVNQAGDPLEDVHFSDMTFIDDVEGGEFAETPDLILLMLAGVRRFSLRRCAFVGFRCDGVNIGIGPHNSVERHNYEGTIEECLFDGVNKNNRNAITVLDCDGLTIRNNVFTRCTRSDMPGCIDVEPNGEDNWYVARNIKIQGNRFIDHGGASVALLLRENDVLDTPHQHFLIEGNYTEGGDCALAFGGYTSDNAATETLGYDVAYRNNFVREAGITFFINGLLGGAITGNQFYDSGDGQLSGSALCKDLLVTQNRFIRCGQNQGPTIAVDAGLEDVTIEDNLFVDCGRPDGAQGWAVYLRGGDLTRVRVRHNIAEYRQGVPSGPSAGDPTMQVFVAMTGGYSGSVDYATCEERDNQAVNYPPSTPQLPVTIFPAYGPVFAEEPADASFANSWVDFGSTSPLRINRNREGRVFIEGGAKSGTVTAGTTMFTLPVGFRPSIELFIPVYSNGSLGSCRITTAGEVKTVAGINNTNVMFDASFRV
jgi:hypothetical protein